MSTELQFCISLPAIVLTKVCNIVHFVSGTLRIELMLALPSTGHIAGYSYTGMDSDALLSLNINVQANNFYLNSLFKFPANC